MLSKIYFQGRFRKRKVKQRSSRRSLCFVEHEVSHNMSKMFEIIFEYSKTLFPYIKKAAVSVMKGLNMQFECTSSTHGGDLQEKAGAESCKEQGNQAHFDLWKRHTLRLGFHL